MDANAQQRVTRQIIRELPTGPRVGILGSSAFENAESEDACREMGRQLGSIPELTVITGGVPGVGETISKSFLQARDAHDGPARVVHLIPPDYPRREHGHHIVVGPTMIDRRQVLARVAPVYISVEGGPGTAHEARLALAHGAHIIPVGRFGGASPDLHTQLERPGFAEARLWSQLADESVELTSVAAATVALTLAALRSAT